MKWCNWSYSSISNNKRDFQEFLVTFWLCSVLCDIVYIRSFFARRWIHQFAIVQPLFEHLLKLLFLQNDFNLVHPCDPVFFPDYIVCPVTSLIPCFSFGQNLFNSHEFPDYPAYFPEVRDFLLCNRIHLLTYRNITCREMRIKEELVGLTVQRELLFPILFMTTTFNSLKCP